MGRHCKCHKHKKCYNCREELAKFNKYFSSTGSSNIMKKTFFQAGANAQAPGWPGQLTSTSFPCSPEKYDMWCADFNNDVYDISDEPFIPNGSGITSYEMLSLLAPNSGEVFLSKTSGGEYPYFTTYFQGINFILNKVKMYIQVNMFTGTDVQGAIWNLIQNNDLSNLNPDFGGIPENVRVIVDEAVAVQETWNQDKNDCKYLLPNKRVGVLLFPQKLSNGQEEVSYQILLLSLTLCQFKKLVKQCHNKFC